MKKFIAATLSVCMLLSFASCSQDDSKKKKSKKDSDETKKREITIEVEPESSETEVVVETSEVVETTVEETEPAPVITNYDYEEPYLQIISDYINELNSNGYNTQAVDTRYDLIHVDDDGTPELVICHPGYSVYLYSYYNGEVHTLMDGWGYGAFGNAGYQYIPEYNMLYNGNSDYAGALYYETYMFMNDNHELTFDDTDRWFQYFEGDSPSGDYLEEPIYFIDGVQVSREDYDANSFGGDYRWIEGRYTADEIRAYLTSETVPTTSYYSIVMGDYTWSEAQELAVSMGGHLATCNDSMEFGYIQSLIRNSDHTDGVFYLGGEQLRDTGAYVWTSDGSGAPINTYDWRDGEPTYTGSTEDGRTVDEYCIVVAPYNTQYGVRYVLMDVPDDTLDAAPSYSGKLGFILEIER